MMRKKRKKQSDGEARPNLLDAARQLLHPLTVAPATEVDDARATETPSPAAAPETAPSLSRRTDSAAVAQLVAELAHCLWYLKTKHFGRAWDDVDPGDEDPRIRRALGRLSRGIDALTKAGAEVRDPVNQRYPRGGESLMRPILQPTAGVTFDRVTETVTPIVYLNGRLIQRGEVFVAVPIEAEETKDLPLEHGGPESPE